MNMINKLKQWCTTEKENWKQIKKNVEVQNRRDNESLTRMRSEPVTQSGYSDGSDGRFWPFGDGGGMA